MTVDVFDTLTLSLLLDENTLANDFAVVLLKRKWDLFITGIFPARNFFFLLQF